MKKNNKELINSLMLFIFFSALIISTITGQVNSSDYNYLFEILVLWVFQTLGVLGIATYLKKSKPNYDWKELGEKKMFTIVSFVDNSFDGEFMEIKPNHCGLMVVNIEGFGKTLMNFPANLLAWQNKAPLIGKNYMRVENNFIQMIVEINNNAL